MLLLYCDVKRDCYYATQAVHYSYVCYRPSSPLVFANGGNKTHQQMVFDSIYIPEPSTNEIVHDHVLTLSKAQTFMPHMDQHQPIGNSQLSAYAILNVLYAASSTSTRSIDDGHQAQGNPTLHQGDAKTCYAQNQTMEFKEMRYSTILLMGKQQESHQVASKESEQGYQL